MTRRLRPDWSTPRLMAALAGLLTMAPTVAIPGQADPTPPGPGDDLPSVTPLHFFSTGDGCEVCFPPHWGLVCVSDPNAYCAACIRECHGNGVCRVGEYLCSCVCNDAITMAGLL